MCRCLARLFVLAECFAIGCSAREPPKGKPDGSRISSAELTAMSDARGKDFHEMIKNGRLVNGEKPTKTYAMIFFGTDRHVRIIHKLKMTDVSLPVTELQIWCSRHLVDLRTAGVSASDDKLWGSGALIAKHLYPFCRENAIDLYYTPARGSFGPTTTWKVVDSNPGKVLPD